MKDILMMILSDCPYCHNARRALAELVKEDARYAQVPVDWVEESRQPELAGRYDYYYVPSVFAGEKKLYEAAPGESFAVCKSRLKAALDAVLDA